MFDLLLNLKRPPIWQARWKFRLFCHLVGVKRIKIRNVKKTAARRRADGAGGWGEGTGPYPCTLKLKPWEESKIVKADCDVRCLRCLVLSGSRSFLGGGRGGWNIWVNSSKAQAKGVTPRWRPALFRVILLSHISLVSSSHASRLSLKPCRRQVLTQSELISRRFCRYWLPLGDWGRGWLQGRDLT